MLRRLKRAGRDDDLDQPDPMLSMRSVLNDTHAERTAAGLLTLTGPNDVNSHCLLLYEKIIL